MSRSRHHGCRPNCGVCADTKQIRQRALAAETVDLLNPLCTCGWITARPVCPSCGLPRIPEAA